MFEIMKIPGTTYKVRFQDCDPFKHLNNSRYFDYFVNARDDQFSGVIGEDLVDLATKQGIGWVITSHCIAYLKSVDFGEKVLIETQVIEFSEKSLKVEMKMWDCKRKLLKAINWSDLVHVDVEKKKAKSHSEKLIQIFQKIHQPIKEKTMDERIMIVLEK